VSLASLYDDVLTRYASDLAGARDQASRWWDELVAREMKAGRSKAEAEHLCRMRWPMGAASHPRIVAIYRRYFLETGAINDEFLSREIVDGGFDASALWDAGPEEEEEDDDDDGDAMIQPAVLLLDGLARRDAELRDFMLHFVFLPIGMDREGVIR
jgi:hypothetical protein